MADKDLEIEEEIPPEESENKKNNGKDSTDGLTLKEKDKILYVHPSDSPGTLLAHKFEGTGFVTWKRAFLVRLSTKSKIGFVTGAVKRDDFPLEKQSNWDKANGMVLAWLFFALDVPIKESVIYFATAAEVWADLCERWDYPPGTRLYALRQESHKIEQGT